VKEGTNYIYYREKLTIFQSNIIHPVVFTNSITKRYSTVQSNITVLLFDSYMFLSNSTTIRP